jgi:hypothetical protein
LSALKFQADMGLLLAFMFLVNMLGAILLLPALAAFLVAGRNNRSTLKVDGSAAKHASVALVAATLLVPALLPRDAEAALPASGVERQGKDLKPLGAERGADQNDQITTDR